MFLAKTRLLTEAFSCKAAALSSTDRNRAWPQWNPAVNVNEVTAGCKYACHWSGGGLDINSCSNCENMKQKLGPDKTLVRIHQLMPPKDLCLGSCWAWISKCWSLTCGHGMHWTACNARECIVDFKLISLYRPNIFVCALVSPGA